MNIAICEDSEFDRQILMQMIRKYCKEYNFEFELSNYKSGSELLSTFSSGKFKLIFLDIYMNDKDLITGIEIAKQIRLYDKECSIVFITSSRDHALDAFEVDAMQYIVKPVNYDKIKHIFDKCRKLFSDNMRFIEVPSNGLSVKILLKDIFYIEVYNKISLIHTNNKVIKTYTSLSRLWELLNDSPFLRCHRSYIINMSHINEILENDFLLKSDDKIPIRKDESLSIKQIYSDYLFETLKSV